MTPFVRYRLPIVTTDPRLSCYEDQLAVLERDVQKDLEARLMRLQNDITDLVGIEATVRFTWTWDVQSPDLTTRES